jgi:hypothetical protein
MLQTQIEPDNASTYGSPSKYRDKKVQIYLQYIFHISESKKMLLRAQIHGRIKKGKVDGYPSSALPWLPEDPSDILSIFPFLSDRVFEPWKATSYLK